MFGEELDVRDVCQECGNTNKALCHHPQFTGMRRGPYASVMYDHMSYPYTSSDSPYVSSSRTYSNYSFSFNMPGIDDFLPPLDSDRGSDFSGSFPDNGDRWGSSERMDASSTTSSGSRSVTSSSSSYESQSGSTSSRSYDSSNINGSDTPWSSSSSYFSPGPNGLNGNISGLAYIPNNARINGDVAHDFDSPDNSGPNGEFVPDFVSPEPTGSVDDLVDSHSLQATGSVDELVSSPSLQPAGSVDDLVGSHSPQPTESVDDAVDPHSPQPAGSSVIDGQSSRHNTLEMESINDSEVNESAAEGGGGHVDDNHHKDDVPYSGGDVPKEGDHQLVTGTVYISDSVNNDSAVIAVQPSDIENHDANLDIVIADPSPDIKA